MTLLWYVLAGGVARKILLGAVAVGVASLPIIWQFLLTTNARGGDISKPGRRPLWCGLQCAAGLDRGWFCGFFWPGFGAGVSRSKNFYRWRIWDFIFAGVAGRQV